MQKLLVILSSVSPVVPLAKSAKLANILISILAFAYCALRRISVSDASVTDASKPMIDITTKSSIRVKPTCFLLVDVLLIIGRQDRFCRFGRNRGVNKVNA